MSAYMIQCGEARLIINELCRDTDKAEAMLSLDIRGGGITVILDAAQMLEIAALLTCRARKVRRGSPSETTRAE